MCNQGWEITDNIPSLLLTYAFVQSQKCPSCGHFRLIPYLPFFNWVKSYLSEQKSFPRSIPTEPFSIILFCFSIVCCSCLFFLWEMLQWGGMEPTSSPIPPPPPLPYLYTSLPGTYRAFFDNFVQHEYGCRLLFPDHQPKVTTCFL